MKNGSTDLEKIWKILHSYEAEIFGYIKHAVGSIDIARDLYQDVYLQALQNLNRLDPERSLKYWLMTVARNRVINYFREKRRRNYITLDDEIGSFDIHPESDVQKAIEYALNRLAENQKEVFILREMDGLNYRELSECLNISIPAVTSLLDRARKNFSKSMILYLLPARFRKNAEKFSLEDLARFADSFDSLENLLQRIHQKSQLYFDSIGQDWDELRQGFIDHHQFNTVFSFLGKQNGLKTLDLGSGTGFISLHCALHGAQVVSIDVNKRMLKVQHKLKNKLLLKHLHLIQAHITDLPLQDSKFDQIFITLVMHHIDDPIDLLQKLASVLKERGRLILIDFMKHDRRQFADQMQDLWLGFEPKRIRRWAKNVLLREVHYSSWRSKSRMEVFAQIFVKSK